jgi:hypothetical protein
MKDLMDFRKGTSRCAARVDLDLSFDDGRQRGPPKYDRPAHCLDNFKQGSTKISSSLVKNFGEHPLQPSLGHRQKLLQLL